MTMGRAGDPPRNGRHARAAGPSTAMRREREVRGTEDAVHVIHGSMRLEIENVILQMRICNIWMTAHSATNIYESQ